jgi:fido (protein-threonine AMPylation protein)
MTHDLPIVPDADFRRSHRFPDLERIENLDLEPSLARFDEAISGREGIGDVAKARSVMTDPGKSGLLHIHRVLFHPRPGAGQLRQSSVPAMFSGQDCPEPEFIDRALDNFDRWLSADSFLEIHAIEQAGLVLTRLVDIWPFDFGNRTAAVVFASSFLIRAGYPPFAVLPGQEEAFAEALSAAIRMQTEPLVGAIYKAIIRELDLADG